MRMKTVMFCMVLLMLNLPRNEWYDNIKIHTAPFTFIYDRIQEETTANIRLLKTNTDTSNHFTLWHKNSLNAAQIDSVLAEYNSPAKGHGNAFVDAGERTNIDNAYVLYIFIHESSAGTNTSWAGMKADGTTTHNIGNIICTPDWQGTCYNRFREYDNWDDGIYAAFDLLAYYRDEMGIETIDAAINTWAPPIENDTQGYIDGLKKTVYTWRSLEPSYSPSMHNVTETMEISAHFNTVNCTYWYNQPNCQHMGVDYPAPYGDNVYMPFDCWYITTGNYQDSQRLGDYVMCTLADGNELYLGHLKDAIRYDTPRLIRAGDIIGTILLDHTHVQLRDGNGTLLDFENYYDEKKNK
jgi:beta-N-acetylglucosaminidase